MAIRLHKEDIEAIARRVVELLLENNKAPLIKDDNDWVTADEAAKILKLSRSRIYQIE